MMSPNEFMKVFSAFRNGPEKLIQHLLSVSSRQEIPAGQQIYHEGDACSAIAFVIAGEIRVYKVGLTGREITLYEIGPGETCILNASCILAGQNYPAHASTVLETDLLLVPSADFRRLVAEHDRMREFVFNILSRRLSGVMELVEEVAFGKMDERLMEYLVERSGENRLEATHQKIANDLGTSREVVSRLLKEFEREGTVRISRGVVELIN